MTADLLLGARFTHYLQFWRALERTEVLPHISRLLDRPDPKIHPWLNIVDVDTDSMQTIRFAGTQLVDYFGKDLTHTNFLDILSPQARPVILQAHREIVRRPCAAYHESQCSTSTGREFQILAMGLPLMRSDNKVSVAWLLEPHRTVSYGEVHILVHSVNRWTWIDLGHGVPET